jgi:4-hydroxy-2-oxoglutarate aldolase
MDLSGIYPPICTPFLDDGEVSPHKLRANVEKWDRVGMAGYCATGSTSEAILLSRKEKIQTWEILRDAAKPGKILIAGTAEESVRETVEMTNLAADLGYVAALVRTPNYYKGQMNRPESQLTYFRAVADQSKIPILIYNFPQVTGVDLPIELLVQLSLHPNILGIKESSGNVEKVSRLVNETPRSFQVLTGSAQTLYAQLCVGAVGAILAFANPGGRAAQDIYRAWKAGDHEKALAAQRHVAKAASITGTKHSIAGLKHAMDLNGYYGGPVRLPLLPLSAAAKAEVEELFREIPG